MANTVEWVNEEILKYWQESKLQDIKKECGNLPNRKIKGKEKTWKEECEEMRHRWPLLYPPFQEEKKIGPEGIVFVGFNPSFNIEDEDIKNIIGTFPFKNEKDRERLKKKIIDSEANAWENYRYFKEIHKVLERINEICNPEKPFTFYHVDLLFMRTTSQKILENLFKIREGNPGRFEEFFNAQFDRSLLFIKKLNPKLIVVINALASKVIEARFDLPSLNETVLNTFYKKPWFYEIPIGEEKFPLLLSGMVSGGRAIDNYSKERLIWHMALVLKEVVEKSGKGKIILDNKKRR